MKKLHELVYISWEESERGWGCRPDGCSLHLTNEDAEKYVKDYWSSMPSEAPDEYERPCSKRTRVLVTSEIYKQIKNASRKYGARFYEPDLRDMESKKQIKFQEKRTGWVPLE